MQVENKGTVYNGLNVVCKDKNGKYYTLLYSDYDESIDEIKVRTVFKSDELQRGWMGDLEYSTVKAREYKIGDIDYPKNIDSVVKDNYKDVLLRSVNIWTMTDGEITWEYTFLKK